MLGLVVEVLNGVIDTLLLCGKFGVLIGYAIVYVISYLVSWPVSTAKSVFSVIRVCLEDFSLFLAEASVASETICCFFCNLLECFGDCFLSKIDTAYSFIVNTFRSVIAKQTALFYTIFELCRHCLRLLFNALYLIGSVSKETCKLLLLFIYNLITAPITSLIYISHELYNAASHIKQTVVTLPMESAIGLFIVVLCIILYRKYNGRRLIKLLLLFCLLSICQLARFFNVTYFLMRRCVKELLNTLHIPSFSLWRLRPWKSGTKDKEISPSKLQLMRRLEQEMSLRLCVICMVNPRDVIVMNCQHFCMCSTCAKQIRSMSNECPVCRKYIFRISQVYM